MHFGWDVRRLVYDLYPGSSERNHQYEDFRRAAEEANAPVLRLCCGRIRAVKV